MRRYPLLLQAWEAATSERPLAFALAALTKVILPSVPYDSLTIIRFQDPASATASGDDFPYAMHITGITPIEGESVQQLSDRTAATRPPPLNEVRPLIPYEPVAFGAVMDGEPWHCNDLLERDGWFDHDFKIAAAGIRAYTSVPLNWRGKTIGAAVFSRLRPRAFTKDQLELLREAGKPLAIAAANAFAYDEIRKLRERLQEENILLREQLQQAPWMDDVVGFSGGLFKVLERVQVVAPTDASVLITGETGTGKEMIARAIHRRSSRAQGPLVKVNCGALPESLIGSELFGHERGAFTGAHEQRKGRFEQANGGTLFLDEVGELSPEMQVMLLRVLQEREFERVGGSRTLRVDVRLIAATNRDLASEVRAGRFRNDLYYRLNVFPIHLPALRERRADIPALVAHFAQKHAKRHGRTITKIDPMALQQWQASDWPGNIRELENEVERAVILASDSVLRASSQPAEKPRVKASVRTALQSQERRAIEEALRSTRGRISGPNGAATALGLKASTLEFRIQRLGIDKFAFKASRG